MKRIFISHSSADCKIGEALLDALVEIGISKEEVFYSSNFHTGVGLGKNFPEEVKRNLKDCELIIFIITKNFYRSPFCMNEMGVAWAFDKPFIPILLDGIEYNKMQGFIDGHYIAISPKKDEMYKVFSYLKENFNSIQKDIDVEKVFDNFISISSTYITKSEKEFIDPTSDISNIEKMILKNKFTDNELLLLDYFIQNQTNELLDYQEYDFDNEEYLETETNMEICEYFKVYDGFDLEKAKKLLETTGYIRYKQGYNGISRYYAGSVLNIDIFRDLLSLSEDAKDIIENVKNKYRSLNIKTQNTYNYKNNIDNLSKDRDKQNEIENFILSSKITEIDALMFKYIIDTSSFILGDRWKTNEQKNHIKMWEDENELNNVLSRNYETALRKLQFKNFVDVYSKTSYDNPREWVIKDEYRTQLGNISSKASKVLDNAIEKNKIIMEDLPF